MGIVYNSQNVKNIFKYVIAKDTFTTKVPVLIESEFTSLLFTAQECAELRIP